MRHWIETGHDKTFWKVPTLLKIAMDVLDDHLDDACCFHQSLERGDMIFANNAMLAHARDQFKNDPNAPPRHKVRAWIQVQKAAILNEENSSTTENVSINSYLVHLQMNCLFTPFSWIYVLAIKEKSFSSGQHQLPISRKVSTQ